MSKSLGRRPSRRSRTAPPTMNAVKPPRCSPCAVLSAHWLIASRPMRCTLNGITFGCAGPKRRPENILPRKRVITVSMQADDGPAAARGMGAQRVVRVHRHRMGHTVEERQIVERVAVEPRLGKGRERAPAPRQPRVEAGDLALAEARNAGDRAGKFAVALLGLGGDQLRDAELARDRRGNEAVGGGDDDAQVLAVTIDQGARLLADQPTHLELHEFTVPGVELGARMARQRLQLEIEELMDVQRAGLVLVVELLVARFVDFAVEHALLDQELGPLEIAVAREQRVVEVEEDEPPA